MSVINKVLGLFLGNKYERDIKEIDPVVEEVHVEFAKLSGLSNDELRDRTVELKKEILEGIKEEEKHIKEIGRAHV